MGNLGRQHKITLALVFLILSGCSHNSTKINERNSGEPSGGKSSDTAEMLPVKSKKVLMPLDSTAVEKSQPLFEAVIKNDDKKAKFAYGRAVRNLPEMVQLAMDLRFKNYEHALTVLPKTSLSQDQKDFWQKLIETKPKKLATAACEALIQTPDFPSAQDKISAEEEAWFAHFESVVQSVLKESNKAKVKSALSESLDKIPNCVGATCAPLTPELQNELLTDAFFDELHNMKRRDTHFWQNNYKNIQTVGEYSPYVTDNELFKFYRSLKATPGDKQNHFLRRFKGIARDMRTETILSRSIADIILEDQEDKALASRLGSFLRNNALISAITRIEGEIPSCHAPAVKKLSAAVPAAKDESAGATPAPSPSTSPTPQ